MISLFIDSHLSDILIIKYQDGNIVDKQLVQNKTANSIYLMPTIIDVIGNDTIDEILVVNGPGSFTGSRLGVTVAKTLAYTKNIPIKTITALELMALSINNDLKKVAFNDPNGYYYGEFDKDMNKTSEYSYYSNKDFKELNKNNDIITDVTIDYNKVYEFLKGKDRINPHLVNPIYVKRIGVEYDKKSS